MSEMCVAECRKGYMVDIPCNYAKNGYCGINARPCF
jgi:hypothetical protein